MAENSRKKEWFQRGSIVVRLNLQMALVRISRKNERSQLVI